MGEETGYVYDNAGNLVEKTDAKGQKTIYVYDDSGRLTDVRYFNPADLVNPVKEVDFTYDDVGNLKTYNDGTTSAAYEYDNAYRKISETVNYGDFSKSFGYTYYDNGLKKSFTGPDGIAYSYTYDANNQLAGIEIPGQGTITYSSYHWKRPENISLPGGGTKSYTYDPLMRVTSIVSKDPGGNDIINYQYNYDRMDNILNKETEHGDYDYDYDEIYRLTSSSRDLITGTSLDEDFTYDKVGNRITSADTTGNWTYNQNNELGEYDNTSFVYDDNGNMISKTDQAGTTTYIYDIENRLVQVSNLPSPISYYYDPFGRRLWKEVGGVRTYFIYADEGLVAELDEAGAEIKTYGYIPESTWTTDPMFMKEGSNYYFYHNDHLGTPQKMTSTNGAIVWSAKYGAFGKAVIDITSTSTNNLRFPGQYYDSETGLHYNYHRYYDPVIGRYSRIDTITIAKLLVWKNRINSKLTLYSQVSEIVPDFIELVQTEALLYFILTQHNTINLYMYGFENPIKYVDSEGSFAWILAGGAVGALWGAIDAMRSGKDPFQAALVGGLTGSLSTAFPGGGMLVGAFIGCGTGILGNFINQISNPCITSIDRASIGKSCIAGSIGGAIGSRFNNIVLLKRRQGPILTQRYKVKIFTEDGQRTFGAMISGFVSGGTDVAIQ